MVETKRCPEDWISKSELLAEFDPGEVTDEKLTEWAKRFLIRHPCKEFGDVLGSKSYYHPETPDRIRIILTVFENGENRQSARFWLWMYRFEVEPQLVCATVYRLFVTRKACEELPEELSEDELLDKADEALREFARWPVVETTKRALSKLLGKDDARSVLDSMFMLAMGGNFDLDFATSEVAEGFSKIASHIPGLDCTDARPQIKRQIEEQFANGNLKPFNLFEAMWSFDAEDCEAMRSFIWFVTENIDYWSDRLRASGNTEIADHLVSTFDLKRSTSNGANIAVAFVWMTNMHGIKPKNFMSSFALNVGILLLLLELQKCPRDC